MIRGFLVDLEALGRNRTTPDQKQKPNNAENPLIKHFQVDP